MEQEMTANLPGKREGKMANEKSGLTLVLSIVAIVVSAASAGVSGYSVWLTHLQDPHIDTFLGENLFMTGEPTIGVSCTFTNAGARIKVINHLLLELKGPKDRSLTSFEVSSVSPSLFTWIYDDKNKRLIQQTNVVHGPFVAFEVPPGGEANRVLWFIPIGKGPKLDEGEYLLKIRAYGDSIRDIASERDFAFRIGPSDHNILVSQPTALLQVTLSQWQ